MNTNPPTKPKKWFGQSQAYRAMQPRLEISPRVVMHIRFLRKAPYKLSYGEFTYAVQPVETEGEKTSYIAARMVMSNGHLYQPLHEYEFSRRLSGKDAAEKAWTEGFEAKEDSFLVKALIKRMIEEEAAEVIPAPVAAALADR